MKNLMKVAAISVISVSSILGLSGATASAAPAESPAVTAPSAGLPPAPTPGEMNTLAGGNYYGPYNSMWQCQLAQITFGGTVSRTCLQHDDGKYWFMARI